MNLLIEDTARNNLSTWAARAIRGGYASGAVLSPFSSPKIGNGYKVGAGRTSHEIRSAGGELWFDAATHALQMPQVGDYRYYDDWGLWSTRRNDLTTPEGQRDHIERVLDTQRELNAVSLAPTILLTGAGSLLSQLALDMAGEARAIGGPGAWISIAGDSSFWTAGPELDAHIGVLDQLEPAGWHLTVTRSLSTLPPPVVASEVLGLMRSTFALSQDRPVVVSHGDFAALPAAAAGARTIGTGWDVRQRVSAYSDYVVRSDAESSGGQWYSRPTLEGLVGTMATRPHAILLAEQPRLAQALTPGAIGVRTEDRFIQHARVLNRILAELDPLQPQAKVARLRERYIAAAAAWDRVKAVTGASEGRSQWIDPLLEGLKAFAAEEGW